MINKDFKSILDLIKAFPDEQSCVDQLESLYWNGNPVSPFDSTSKVYKCKDNKYKCKNTGKYFNVRTGTLFDNTKIELQKWFLAIYLHTAHKKGISSLQLGRDINVTQKTAWFMLQRIRACFGGFPDEQLENEIEIDETFVGGKNKNRHANKKVPQSQGRSFKDKTPVLGILQRDGKLIATVIENTSKTVVQPIVLNTVKEGSTVITDEWSAYHGLSVVYDHHIVNHAAKEYVNIDNRNIHSNTIEGFWSLFKRGIIGIYHFTSRKHLQKYVDEFTFRYNSRNVTDNIRFNLMLSNIGTRLTYKQLING